MRPLSLQKFMAQHAPKTAPKKIEIPKAPEDGKDYFHGTHLIAGIFALYFWGQSR